MMLKIVFFSLALLGQLLAGVRALSSDVPYDYGYDDGNRGPLLQLYDGLYIQDYVQRTEGDNTVSVPFSFFQKDIL